MGGKGGRGGGEGGGGGDKSGDGGGGKGGNKGGGDGGKGGGGSTKGGGGSSGESGGGSGSMKAACSFMLCDLDFEPLSLSLSSLPSCDLVSLTNMLILLHYLKSFNSELAEVFVFKS
ncbi:hypothetical protein Tco_0765838 [Tanacetum coccineum]